MANPLMRKRLDPIPGAPRGTATDFESRLKGAMHPGEAILSKGMQSAYKIMNTSNSNMYKTSAPLHLNIAPEDNMSTDTRESKTPYESLIFDPLNREPIEHFTYIESLKTGKFLQMMKKNMTFEDKQEEYTPMEIEEKEKIIYKRLQLWAERLHKLFLLLQGFLGGVALLHIYLMFFNMSDSVFLTNYSQIARIVAMMLHILIFFALVGALVRMISERKHYKHKEATEYGYDTDLHRLPFYIALLCSILYFIAYGLTTFTAKFDNEMHFEYARSSSWAVSGVSGALSSRLRTWVALCTIRDILVIIAWLIFCTQFNWNIGSEFIVKIETLEGIEYVTKRQEQAVYRHLFYGNPYLPYGVYIVNNKESETQKKKKT